MSTAQQSTVPSMSASTTLRGAIEKALAVSLTSLGLQPPASIVLEQPAESDRGDLASPIAMQLIRTLTPEQRAQFSSPLQLASAIVRACEMGEGVESMEAVAPGFINIRYSQRALLSEALRLASAGKGEGATGNQVSGEQAADNHASTEKAPTEQAPTNQALAEPASISQPISTQLPTSQVIIEYVSPNTNKPLHIGHLRNAAIGWSLDQLLTAGGAQVHKAIIFNDRGRHIMKSCWGYLAAGRLDADWKDQVLSGELSPELIDRISARIGTNSTITTSATISANATPTITTPAIPTDSTNSTIPTDSTSAPSYEPQPAPFSWQSAVSEWCITPDQWLSPEAMTEARLRKNDHFIGFWYQLSEHFAEQAEVNEQWSQMLQCWEDENHPHHQELRKIWSRMNEWFYQGFEKTRQRFGFGFDPDQVSYESAIYQKGKELVVAAADQGILERLPDGAVVARLESVGLPDKILLRSDGTGIYMTFDIELTRQRTSTNADKLIWIVGDDQKLSFQQLFAITEMLGFGTKDRYHHLAHGMVRLPEGKMSSRKGRVLYADDILDLAVQQATTIMRETGSTERLETAEFDRVAEAVGIGAVKWTMLSVDPLSEITFDIASSVSFKGYAGPYVQYTYARCQSVLRLSDRSHSSDFDIVRNILSQSKNIELESAEIAILRNLFTYYEIVRYSAETRSPHVLCNYLYELCQRFNTFYAVCPILSDASLSEERKELRLVLTSATAQVLRQGLELLGIEVVERM